MAERFFKLSAGLLCLALAVFFSAAAGITIAEGLPYAGTPLGDFYSGHYSRWEYVSDVPGADIWECRPDDYRGDCEDFAITFYGTLHPRPRRGWVVVVPGEESLHAVLFLQDYEGRWFYVDNQRPWLVEGTDFLDLYYRFEKVIALVELPPPEEVCSMGDLRYLWKP